MRRFSFLMIVWLAIFGLFPSTLRAEILAALNYETKPEQTIRREGIAIIDVDPESQNFGKILVDIPLPPNLVAHHLSYNKNATKAYITALEKSVLHVMDMTRFPYRMKAVDIPECKVLEDVILSEDNKTWYLTCMGSQNVIVGDATTDQPIKAIALPKPYPHGISLHPGIDRLIVTSTIRPDGKDPGETVTVLQASTGEILSTHKVSNKASPSGEAPVEVLFMPKSEPAMVYITNMGGGTLWMGVWDSAKKDFNFHQAFDFASVGSGVPLEMYFNNKKDRFYVTTAMPGHFHIFDISQDPKQPKLLKSIPTAGGAHHVAFTPDERYAFVQNSFINLPGMSDGSVTVIDLAKGEVIKSMDTLKHQGLNPNSIVLLPEWNHDADH